MKEYYIYKNGYRYEFTFFSLWAATQIAYELGGCVVDADTGEVLAEKD